MIRDIINEIKGSKYPIPDLDDAKVDVWASWYKGKVKNIHTYHGYDGVNTFSLELKSMGMAKRICEDWADLLLNERTDIVLSNDDATTQLHNILRDTNFWIKANDGIEKTFALGLGSFVIGVDDVKIGERTGEIKPVGKLRIDFVDRFKIRPITIENKIITESAFEIDGSKYTDYIIHVRGNNGNYVIHNYRYDKEKKKLDEGWQFDTKSDKPWFQMIRPFVASNDIMRNYDTDLGVSIFANAIDTLKAIDNKYDSFDNEFVAGRKRLFTTEEIWNVSNKVEGGKEKTFNPLQSIFYKIPVMGDADNKVEDSSGPLRATEHILALNTELSILSDKCGMGVAYYKFDGSGAVTATQVVSENSGLFRSIKKHEILIDSALYGMTEVLIEASKIFTANPINIEIKDAEDIRILFDDSIIEDKGAEMERDKSFVAAGLMSPVEFRVKWMGEDEEQATDNYRKYFKHIIMANYMQALVQGAMTPAQFVLEVWGAEDAEVEAYIEERLKQGSFNDFISLYEGDETGEDDDSEGGGS